MKSRRKPHVPHLDGVILDGRYRIERRIGAGGMGAVYQATPLAGGLPVAIKLLLPRHNHDYTYRQRFVREARVASSIVHPNVMRVLDYGETEAGRAFSVMECLPGEDLGQLLKREGALGWARTRAILRQVIRGLRAAHEMGVLHRDVKPSNVFLVRGRQGRPDYVKLLDFGLAKAVDPASSLAEGLTLVDEVMGTAQYLAPERLLGEDADARSDLYSVGVMAFRMLSGSLPHWGHGNSAQTLLHRCRRPPPSVLDEAEDLPPAVDLLLRRAMALDPHDRFSSLRALEDEMMRIPVDGQVMPRRHVPTMRYGDLPTRSLPRTMAGEAPPTLTCPTAAAG